MADEPELATMTQASEELLRLARRLEACAEDAKRPEPTPQYGEGIARSQPASIISLANGIEAIAAALRALANKATPHG